jgi:hypothetical protein
VAIRIELSAVQHPYKLCMICNEALGWHQVTIEPGHPNQRTIFVCNDHLGRVLQDFGESVIRMLEKEREERGE